MLSWDPQKHFQLTNLTFTFFTVHWALASPAGLKSQGKARREASLQQINPSEKQSWVLLLHSSVPSVMKNDLRCNPSSPHETACTRIPSAAYPNLLLALTVTVTMETVLTSALPEVPHARSELCAWCHRSCSPNPSKTVRFEHTRTMLRYSKADCLFV